MLVVRPITVEQTWPLRPAVLRPHLTIEQMVESEPAGAFAVGAFDCEELVAVSLIGLPEIGPHVVMSRQVYLEGWPCRW